MPKFSREMEDKIVALFEQGKRNSVISRELSIDRGALPRRRKAWEKRKSKQETPEPEKGKTQEEHPLEPEKYARAPINHLASLSQINVLEKRISELEESQRGSKPYLLKRRISDLETSQRLDMRIINSSITDFRKMKEELTESAKRRHWKHHVCKQINPKGYCIDWFYEKDEIPEYIKSVAWGEYEGRKAYYINVREHPIVCSACPDYEPKS